MSKLLDLLDTLMAQSVESNVYSDLNKYTNNGGLLAFKNGEDHPHPHKGLYNSQTPENRPVETHRRLSSDEIYQKNVPQSTPPSPEHYLGFLNGGDTSLEKIAPPQGQIRKQGTDSYRGGNLYDDRDFAIGGKFNSLSQKPVPSPARFFDVFAITHWLRDIAREMGVGEAIKAAVNKAGGNIDDLGGFASKNPADIPERVSKGITWVASQALLGALNPGDPEVGGVLNQIVNPFSFAAASVPGIRGTTTLASPNLAAAASVNGEVYSLATKAAEATKNVGLGDRLTRMRKGLYFEFPGAQHALELRSPNIGFYGNLNKKGEQDTLQLKLPSSLTDFVGISTIEGQVDQEGLSSLVVKAAGMHTNLYTETNKYPESRNVNLLKTELEEVRKTENKYSSQIFSLESSANVVQHNRLSGLFLNKFGKFDNISSLSPFDSKGKYEWVSKTKDPISVKLDSDSINPNALGVRFDFLKANEKNGVVKGENANVNNVEDDELYMPFMFQDLRDKPPQFLYFRAFIRSGFSETFTPDWNLESFYGRVDQVPVYRGTARNISLSFDVVAWTPVDLPIMYKKLHKLQSMVYPLYDTRGFLQAGPIIRIRLGDLISAGNKIGTPGYFTSLDYNYDDTVWSLEDGFRAPRKVTVSCGITLLHEGNPGIYPFKGEGEVDSDNIFVGTGNSLNSTEHVFGARTFEATKDSPNIKATNINSRIRGIIGKVDDYYKNNGLE